VCMFNVVVVVNDRESLASHCEFSKREVFNPNFVLDLQPAQTKVEEKHAQTTDWC
jgi:hypothetical protein